MNKTRIGWADLSSNPVYATDSETGKRGWMCEMVSRGCHNCYAQALNLRYGNGLPFTHLSRHYVKIHLDEKELREWAKPKYAGKKVFVCDMTDLFGDWVAHDWLDKIFAAMALAPAVTFQVLTKRPERMRDYLSYAFTREHITQEAFGVRNEALIPWPLPNVWLGISAEDQEQADKRIPVLLKTPAAVRFVSYEPALEAVDLRWQWFKPRPNGYWGRMLEIEVYGAKSGIDWIICGAESGPQRRPFDNEWARSAMRQCREAGVACYLKQSSGRFSETPFGDAELDACKEFPR